MCVHDTHLCTIVLNLNDDVESKFSNSSIVIPKRVSVQTRNIVPI